MNYWRPRILDLYLARSVLLTTLVTWAVLSGFDAITAFASELDEIGEGGYTLGHAILHVFFTMPRRLYEVFPTVALIGCLLGLGGLSGRSELTAMRAVGLSQFRIGLGAILALAVLTGLMVVNAETLGPAGEQRSQAVAASAKAQELIVARYSGLWAREGNVFLNARTGAQRQDADGPWIELQGVRLFEFDDEGRLQSLAQARIAERRDGHWILHDVLRHRFKARAVKSETVARERWRSRLDEAALVAAVSRPRYLSASELSSNIDYLRRNSLDAAAFESAYWSRWFYPLNVLALCLAALPFAFGSLRSGGFAKRLFLGIVLGVAFILAQKLFVNLADVYRFDVRLALVMPPLLVLGLSWALFARRI